MDLRKKIKNILKEEVSKNQTNENFITDKIKDAKESWSSFVSAAKREGRETKQAVKILNKLLKGVEITNKEKELLKHQSKDLAKIVTVMSLGAVSMVIPLTLEKILNRYGISIMPTEYKSDETKE